MEEYKVAVTTKLNGQGVLERMITVRADTLEEAKALYQQAMADLHT